MRSVCLWLGPIAILLGGSPACLPQSQPSLPASEQTQVNQTRVQEAAHATQQKSGLSEQERTGRFLEMPLDFELNRGQAPGDYEFVAHGPSYALGISPNGVALALARPKANITEKEQTGAGSLSFDTADSSRLELRFVGSVSSSQVTGLEPQPGRSNYFIGNDPSQWRRDVPHFKRAEIQGVYPGINVDFYGNREHLEYDFDVAPEADPGSVRLRIGGAESVALDRSGNAILHTAAGDVELQRPVAYQEIAGVRRSIDSAFQIADGHVLQFVLGSYDRSRALVIDPVLMYGVELGGSNGNQAMGLAVDSAGNTYISGLTCSADFASTAGNFDDSTINPERLGDCNRAFVVKLDPTASTLIYSDFIGGTRHFSAAGHLTIDSAGDVYVVGATGSSNFPVVSNIGPSAPQDCGVEAAGEVCPVGFVLKLSPDGSQILFSSLLGGSEATLALQVKLNPVTGDLVVLGQTDSSSFLPAPTSLETSYAGGSCYDSNPCFNGFLLGLDPVAGTLRYGTFIGGTGNVWGSGLAFDASGNIYVAGSALSALSSSLGTITHTYAPSGGATASGASLYVAKFLLSANQLTPGYLTVIQGDGDTSASGIVLDSSGNLYVSGASAAQHLPVTSGVYQSTNKSTFGNNCIWPKIANQYLPNPCGTGLVGKFDSTGALSFLTYLGGSGQDAIEAIGAESSGNLWLGGTTSSTDFPYSSNHYTETASGFSAPFLAEMSNDGTQLLFATPIAGASGMTSDLQLDSSNNVYVTGFASSAFITPGVYPANPNVYSPLFVQKWSPGTAPSISFSANSLSFASTAAGASSPAQTLTIQNTGTVTAELGVSLAAEYPGETPSDFPESTTCSNTLAAGASCTVTVGFEPGAPSQLCLNTQGCNPNDRSAHLLVSSNATQGSQYIGLGGSVAVGAGLYISPNPIVFPAQTAGTTSAQLSVTGGSTGDAPFIASNIALSGPNASDFQLQLSGSGLACLNNPVYPGTYCTLTVTFSPPASATGTRTATLTFTDNTGDSPQTVAVSGTVASANFLNISPLNLAPEFPVAIGTSSTIVLDLQNPSTTASVQVTGLSIAGTNMGDFSVTSENCTTTGSLPMTIASGATCYVDIAFAPQAGSSGTRTATLTVQTTPAATGLPTVALSGDAVTNSQPGLSTFEVPNPLNFGGLQVGETSNNASVLFNVSNYPPIPCAGGTSSCGAPLIVSSITPGLSDYTVTAQSTSCTPFPVTIASGSNCTFAVVFKPTQAGPRNTTIAIQSNDPQGTVQLPVYGTGLSLPLAEVLGSSLAFGNSAIGVASPPLTATLQNAGPAGLAISGVAATSNFAISANTCTGTLAPQATCTISVTFTPPAAGSFTGTLTISDNDAFGGQQTVTLTGSGATGPQLRITPQSVVFGNQAAGTTSGPQTVTFANTGDSTVTFPATPIRVSTLFVLQSTTCGGSLPAGMSCTVNVQYQPTKYTGIPDYGSLLVTDNVTGSPQPVYLQGTATQSTLAATTTALVSSLNPSSSGQSVTFTATVTGPTGNTTVPTGSVNFLDSGINIGSGTVNGSGVATYSTSSLSVGSHWISATYSGDSNFALSNSTVVIQVVNTSTKAASTTSLLSSLNPSTSGQSVAFTATVTGPSGNTTVPTGSVNFLDGTTTLGSGTLNGSGVATYSSSAIAVGTHSITAVYGGDGNFNGSTSGAIAQVVNPPAKATSTTTVASFTNPSTAGQSVAFIATVTGPSGNTTVPTGSVNFLDGTTMLGSGTLNGSGTVTYSTSSLSTGSHSITAVYTGDTNFNGSTSSVLMQVVNPVAKLTSTTAVTSSLNPSGQGQSVTFTATVTGPSGNSTVPTGSITFMDGSTTLGTGSLNGSAQATYTTSSLANGSHSITAVYGGDGNFAGSTSPALTQTVNAPGFTVSAAPGSVSVNPGQTGTATITVTPQNGFNQQVSFACSGLPAASTCSFSPATVTPNGAAATTTVSIATDVAMVSPDGPSLFGRRGKEALFAILLLGLGGLFRARRRWRSLICVIVLLAGLGLAIGGCGGKSNNGNNSGSGGSTTPAGTSTITVTATAGSLSQTGTFTLVVQ